MNYVKTLQDQLALMAKGFVQYVPTLVIALIVLIVTWILAKFAVAIAERLTRNTPIRDKVAIGDTIECQNITGKVERITLRETYIRAPSNELSIVPNSVLFKNPMKVTTDSPLRRFELVVAVANDADLDQASSTIRTAVEGVEDIEKTHPVEVFAQEFKAGEVDFLVRWWSASRKRDLPCATKSCEA